MGEDFCVNIKYGVMKERFFTSPYNMAGLITGEAQKHHTNANAIICICVTVDAVVATTNIRNER